METSGNNVTSSGSLLPAIHRPKYLPNRPLDFLYDPTFTVNDPKEYYKTVHESMMNSSDFVVQPNYSSMFSDVARYPRVTLVLKSANPIPDDMDPSYKGKVRSMRIQPPDKKADVMGADRFKYFRKPLLNLAEMQRGTGTGVQYDLFSQYTDNRPSKDSIAPKKMSILSRESNVTHQSYFMEIKCDSTYTQTDYRETEVQTIPWEPPYVVNGTVTPEILTLTSLSWGHGLPAGVHEVEIIERARMKRAWEKIIPTFDTPEIAEKKYRCLADLEKDEWRFRAEEIEVIQGLRMELAEELKQKKKLSYKEKLSNRIEKLLQVKDNDLKRKLKIERQKKDREIRKLERQYQAKRRANMKPGALEEITDPTSQTNGPMLMFGVKCNRHEEIIIDKTIFQDYEAIRMLENFSKKNKKTKTFDYVRLSKPKECYEMCPRIMKWSEENIEKFQSDLEGVHMQHDQFRTPSIIQKLPPIIKEPPLLFVPEPFQYEAEMNWACAFLQKLIRGRATQCLMHEDRFKFKYLIEEVKSTHALEEHDMKRLTEIRYNALRQSRMNDIKKLIAAKKHQMIGLFKGEVAADLLDFLAKEQERLEDEQRVHAFAMLAERERWRREGAESGRRQREDICRRKQDEAFKQVMKIRQETVDIYLEDVIMRSMNWLADNTAREHIRRIAKQIDLAAHEANARGDIIEQEEMISHLLHNFVVPEAHKEIVRHKLEARQRKYLEIAQKIVYDQLLTSDPLCALEKLDEYKDQLELTSSTSIKTATKEVDEKIEIVKKESEASGQQKTFKSTRTPMRESLKKLADFSVAFTRKIVQKAEQVADFQPKSFVQEITDSAVKKIYSQVNEQISDILNKAINTVQIKRADFVDSDLSSEDSSSELSDSSDD